MQKSSKSSKGKSRSRWGEFSQWTWDDNQQFWYRVRQDAQGNYDYDYERQSGSASQPRSDNAVDEITQGVANLPSSGDWAEGDEYTVSSEAQGGRSKSRPYKSSGKGKDSRRAEYDYSDPEAENTSRHIRSHADEDDQAYAYSSSTSSAASDVYGRPSTAYHSGAYHTAAGPSSGPAYGGYNESAYVPVSSYDHDHAYATAGPAYSYPAYDSDDNRATTPRPGASGSSSRDAEHTLTADYLDALDPRYRIERSDRFQPGEIFKAGWAEPKGSANDVITGVSGKQEITARGVTFITGFRRFIVIANDLGHSTCVPIFTYGGKACTKRGVKAEKHGIIYMRGQKAKLLEGEPKLGFPPVKVDLTMEGEKLSKESRVNYSKLVTVEHNVKVMFIGTIAPHDWPVVTDAINRCWDQKDHHKKTRHRK